MRLDPDHARALFAASPVLRLATASAAARPHVVPCTFVLDGQGRIAIGIDTVKPKSGLALRRLRNIAENPQVSAIADHYDADWRQLWWARADGTAAVAERAAEHWALLAARYPRYRGQQQDGPVILVTVRAWSGWSAA